MMRIESAPAAAPILVFGIGNPSRGDDALGPLLIERLMREQAVGRLPGVDLLTDFQFQPEHALDLRTRRQLVVVDANLNGAAPFAVHRLAPDAGMSHSTHAMGAAELLAITLRLYGRAPDAWLLAVRGVDFELGSDLSSPARDHLDAVTDYLIECRCRLVSRRQFSIQALSA
ncbi:MAG: hypothetical protein N838_10105 [Thiohalocapsa sp. PB-PSB1]|jgi:hydrogenase maturation protease|nr:MAG: hypothetical protein N838_10105 [Thiohalocapsa sp. PB-PSB1]